MNGISSSRDGVPFGESGWALCQQYVLMTIWERCGRKQSWPILKHYPNIWLEEMGEKHRKPELRDKLNVIFSTLGMKLKSHAIFTSITHPESIWLPCTSSQLSEPVTMEYFHRNPSSWNSQELILVLLNLKQNKSICMQTLKNSLQWNQIIGSCHTLTWELYWK